MKLSKVERLILYNQYEILKKLDPENADYYENAKTILENGFTSEYETLVEHLDDDYPETICTETLDILQMFRSLYFSYEELQDKDGIKERDVKFQGFDGNEEGRYYSLALYYIKDAKLYQEFKDVPLNSHFPKLDKYRAMLLAWKKYGRYDKLTKDQILEIINAIDLY